MEIIALVLFATIFISILWGYPVGLTLGGLSILAGIIFVPDFLDLLPLRIMGVMENQVLIAVPLFIFMGLMFEKSGLAERLLETMSILLGRLPGGLAISVVVVGTLLAASSGIVGATVITMGLISLPVMLKRGYSPELACGTICSSGTLGQIIPPSVVLILLGSVMNIPVGALFTQAIIPGLILVLAYCLYILVYSWLYPSQAPALTREEITEFKSEDYLKKTLEAFIYPMGLILAVLGSIFFGIATPTEAAAVGAMGAMILTFLQSKLNFKIIKEVSISTGHLTSMVFLILLGATTFSLVFRGLGGERFLVEVINQSNLSPIVFLLLVMLLMFVAGFFIDFIEIVFIVVPVVTPIFISMKMDLIWIGILMAINLQTSFLSPPFGFALFYLKGVAPPEVSTSMIYRGIVPFIIIQVAILMLVFFYPGILKILVI
jgi:tripartite ATP-independent transporter DctM subunit